jgi:hypothetical protein
MKNLSFVFMMLLFGAKWVEAKEITVTVNLAETSGAERIVEAKGFVVTNGFEMNNWQYYDLQDSIKSNAYSQCCTMDNNNCARVNQRGMEIISMSKPQNDTRRIDFPCTSYPADGCGEYYTAKGYSSVGRVKCL